MIAFAAVAQFAPGILAALYWKVPPARSLLGHVCRVHSLGYLLFLPNLIAGGLLPSQDFAPPESLAWLWPHAVMGIRASARQASAHSRP